MKRLKKVQDLLRKMGTGNVPDVAVLEGFRAGFTGLGPDEKLTLYRWMGAGLEVPRDRVEMAFSGLEGVDSQSESDWVAAMMDLRRDVESPRRRALENLVNLQGGIKLLLEMRADVLDAQRAGESGLEAIDREIADLLNGWFRHGFLFLEEIDRNSAYSKIQYLKERELVHPMVSLEEMGERLGQDRKCFALCHVAMPDEPVVFIEVALNRGLVRSIHEIIERGASHRAPVKSPDTAIFYSINNTQNGLTGLGLGKVLIFRVTEALRDRHPGIKTLATLSPVPEFWPRYLLPILRGEKPLFSQSRDDIMDRISPKAIAAMTARHLERTGTGVDVFTSLIATLSDPTWIDDPELSRLLEKPLTDTVYHYVADETDPRGKPLNPVAGFHLGNGATIAKKNVNFGANTSERGLSDSCGVMVNYIYSASTLARLSRTVRSLLPWVRR